MNRRLFLIATCLLPFLKRNGLQAKLDALSARGGGVIHVSGVRRFAGLRMPPNVTLKVS